MIGPGKYDAICTSARERASAEAVLLVILNGKHGNGFSVQAPLEVQLMLPELLDQVANDMRGGGLNASLAASRRVDRDHTSLLLALGKVTGWLQQPEHRDRLADSVRSGALSRGYLQLLRDRLNEVLGD